MAGAGPFPVTFFLVGASKAGTTYLAEALSGHDDICMSRPKEPSYLSSYPGYGYHHYGEAFYRKCFAHWDGEAQRGDASVAYMWDPALPGLIAAHNGEARILFSLRDPVERTVSSYHELLKAGTALPSLEAFVVGDSEQLHWVLERNDYRRYLERYAEVFGRAAVHVVLHERLRNDRRGVVDEVLGFLGLPAFDAGAPLPQEANVSFQPRSVGLQRHVLRNRRLLWPVKRLLPAGLLDRLRPLRQRLESANRGQRSELSAAARAGLAQRCRPQVEALQDYLGVDLGHWPTMTHGG